MGRPRKNQIVENTLNQQFDEEKGDVLSGAEIYETLNDSEVVPTIEETKKRPRYIDPEWHDFVMSQFVPEELDNNGNPKVDGLRRVAEGLLGEIVESRPVQSSSSADLAAVNWLLVIEWACDNPYVDINNGQPLPRRSWGAFCDAHSSNCKSPFNKFLASLCDTRAESKALRRALRLRCISAEEAQLGETDTFEEKTSDGSYKGEAPINEQQRMMIGVISLRLNIDQNKLVHSMFPDKVLEKLTKENAASVITQLNKYQTSVKKGSQEIPEEIKLV